jgi:hypothetical protein
MATFYCYLCFDFRDHHHFVLISLYLYFQTSSHVYLWHMFLVNSKLLLLSPFFTSLCTLHVYLKDAFDDFALPWATAISLALVLALLIPRPGALACRNQSSCFACEAIDPVLGTAVTMTFAPKILRRMPRMDNQYGMPVCKLGGPRTSKPYIPVCMHLSKKKNCFACKRKRTAAQDDGVPRCAEWIIEHGALHQAVNRTTAVLILVLVLSWVAIRTGHRSRICPVIDVHSGRLGKLLRTATAHVSSPIS